MKLVLFCTKSPAPIAVYSVSAKGAKRRVRRLCARIANAQVVVRSRNGTALFYGYGSPLGVWRA